MAQRDDRRIVVDGHTALLVVDIGLIGCEAQLGKELGGAQELVVGHHLGVLGRRLVETSERHGTAGFELLRLQA